jgi:hypothetical protein
MLTGAVSMQAMQTVQAVSRSEAALAGRALGAMFFFAFGGLWLAAWAAGSGYGVTSIVSIAVLAVVLLLVSWRRYRRYAPAMAVGKDDPKWQRARRIFNMVNAGQWIVIFVAALALGNTGHEQWIVPMVIGVVGMHFFPLAAVFENPPHYVTGAAMVALAILYPCFAGPRSPLGALGAGIILWLSAAWALRPDNATPV